jgi:hypothetical protein
MDQWYKSQSVLSVFLVNTSIISPIISLISHTIFIILYPRFIKYYMTMAHTYLFEYAMSV